MRAIRRFSKADAGRWRRFSERVARLAGFLRLVYETIPPQLPHPDRSDWMSLLRLGARLRLLGEKEMFELMRVLPMSVAEFLDDWFETDVLKGVLGAGGIAGLCQGPLAAGTAALFLHHHLWCGKGVFRTLDLVEGGIGNLTQTLVRAAREKGVEVRTGAEVARVRVQDGRGAGVILADGEVVDATRVVSNVDPRRTFLHLVDPVELDPAFVQRVRNIKFRGVCAKVNLALERLPRFVGVAGKGWWRTRASQDLLRGVISISPSLTYLEQAYDDAKYGKPSQHPYLEAVIPSLMDPTLAPEGQHVMSVTMQYAPYHLREGEWDDTQRQALGKIVLNTLAAYAPDIHDVIRYCQVLTPRDLERRFALTEGNIYHGEMTLDQWFFMRPVPGWARYRTPIEGLYLCGAGTHPGGGITGVPGYNAARAILQDIQAAD